MSIQDFTKALSREFNPNKRAYPFDDGDITKFITVKDSSVAFKGQTGPIKEVGVNGCQIDDIIVFVRLTLQAYNEKHHCRENNIAINRLEEAELWLLRRRQDREDRDVEGTDKD